MAIQARAIKRRMKSVRNTRKITKAMELVSASKMRRSVSSVLGTRPYASLAWELVSALQKKTDEGLHPLLRRPDHVGRVLVVLITSDRGLAAGFNVNMIRKALGEMGNYGPSRTDVICLGRRGADAIKKAGYPIIASFTELTNHPRFQDIIPIARLAKDEFVKGSYDKVILAYTDFVSAISQKPAILELLPLHKPVDQKIAGEEMGSCLFEPNPKQVLDRLLPQLIETTVYQALLESAASEHSARMMAMRSASDAAGEMIDALSFTYNQARQASITQEIAEISSGKAALENN